MLFMRGGPSPIDSFDYKPALEKLDGKTIDSSLNKGAAKGNITSPILKSPFKFIPSGKSGIPISEVFPEIARHADDLCVINSMHHKTPIHFQGTVLMHTGHFQFTRPSAGSWVVYGLGSESQELPGYLVMNPLKETMQCYQSAFLPASYTATPVNVGGVAEEVVRNVANKRLSPDQQKAQLDLIQSMNQGYANQTPGVSELDAVIESYERGFKMQAGVPKVLDLSKESAATLKLYGLDQGKKGGGKASVGNFAMQCLLARRFAEADVRFIEVTHNGWDHHGKLKESMTSAASAIDGPIAGLLTDLKSRGMLDETLVVWGGEFGRTTWMDGTGATAGRTHNAAGFTYWLAGGGVKGGLRYGATDETGWFADKDSVHPHDLHATMLHLLSLDYWNLTFKYGGRDYRLSDVDGKVVKGILA